MAVEGEGGGTGPRRRGGHDFRVRPGALHEYAATVRGQGGALADVGGNLAAIAVEPAWFGKLPQSGHLAERYETHHQAGLAGITELMKALVTVASALEATGGAYSGADAAAADALRAVRGRSTPVPRPSLSPSLSPNPMPMPMPMPSPSLAPVPTPSLSPSPSPAPALSPPPSAPAPTASPTPATRIAEAIR